VNCTHGGSFTIEVCSPDDERSGVEKTLREGENILTKQRVSDCLQLQFLTEHDHGDTVFVGNEKSFMELDLIPVAPFVESDNQSDRSFKLLVLIGSVYLAPAVNNKAYRDFQRGMLANLLRGWWVLITSAKWRLPNVAPTGNDAATISERFPDWLVVASLAEVLRFGTQIAKALRVNSQVSAVETWEQFITNRWEPRLPVGDDVRSWAPSLLYWCHWVNSHREVEREQAAAGGDSLPHLQTRRPFVALKQGAEADTTAADARNLPSTIRWVSDQRAQQTTIGRHLGMLRLITAQAFQTGASLAASGRTQDRPSATLPLGGRSLLCYSMNRWLSPKGVLRRDLKNDVLSDLELCRVMHGVAVTSHYLLGDQPLTEDVVHRLMQLIARYGHGDLRIPRRLDLRAQLLHAARGEPALHTLKQFYRDHFFHALEVCFLGHLLLEAKLDDRQRLWQLVAKFLDLPQDKNRILRLWYVAALLHDTGYAMDVLNSSREFLGFFRHSKALRRLCERFKEAVAKLSEDREVVRLGIAREDRLGQDHGVVGALHVQSLLKRIARDDPSVDPSDYAPAVRAIALHNLRRHDPKVKFSKEPLAFLLAICDQLQEWRRPRLSFPTAPNFLMAQLEDPVQASLDLEGPFKSLRTNLEVLNGGKEPKINLRFRRSGKGNPLLCMEAEYDAPINRNSGVFELWLDATLNFQRLDFEGLNLDIAVTYVTPYCDDRHRSHPPRQMDRLRNAAYETHMTCLEDWFPNQRVKEGSDAWLTNGAVAYRYDDLARTEHLRLDLRALTKQVLMTGRMDTFRSRLREWKHANDDRDFPGDYANVVPE